MEIEPCTTGRHSTIDETPKPEPKKPLSDEPDLNPVAQSGNGAPPPPRIPQQQAVAATAPPEKPAPPADDDDDPAAPVPQGASCKRRGCDATYTGSGARGQESCVHHPGQALFHEGSKGWTCCKRRVLEFDEFLRIEGCKTKDLHLFVGSKKASSEEEKLDSVR